MKLSAISDSKPSWLEYVLGKLLTRRMSTVGNWLLMLSEHNAGGSQKRMKNAVGDWLPMLPGRNQARSRRKRRELLAMDLILMLPGREPGSKQNMNKSAEKRTR